MDINIYGQVSLTEKEILDALYSGQLSDLGNILAANDVVSQYNDALRANKDNLEKIHSSLQTEESIEFFDETNQCTWFMPENYCPNLIENLYKMCHSEEERLRVDNELKLFIQHGMFDLLFYLKYLVDTMRSNNIVWGVGRGSSVASYVLFLLGIHKINSIKYELDISEFLKES